MTSAIYTAKVMHKRLFPKVNQFTYGVYYLALPLDQLGRLDDGWRFGVNRRALVSFHERDHGARDGSPLEPWIRGILAEHAAHVAITDITLITMPRIFGYVFNPVSFWLCFDASQQLRAVLAEVHNTFGEAHNYLIVHSDGRALAADDLLYARKIFHVSPFLPREGSYQFRFAYNPESMGVTINYYDAEGQLQLITMLNGQFNAFNRMNLRRAFWQHKLVTLKTISLIHYQAIKLIAKGVRYIVKPSQLVARLSVTQEAPISIKIRDIDPKDTA
ncbi:MAG: DUF1365 domain-containing protein [Rickettsiales bacterium]|nr:DUF1365 domain-containing protein [Rickettsiales bacterium]